MFDRGNFLRYPTNSRQCLWRYLPYERLLDLLRSEELYFTHVPAFSDGLEGSLTDRTRERLFSWFKMRIKLNDASAREQVRKYEEDQEDFYASCWHMNDFESYLMWKAYAERGFAIRTTYERVQAAFDRFNGAVTGGVVKYVDFTQESTPVGSPFYLVTTKDLSYRDEREFRLLLWARDPKNSELQRSGKGIRIPVDVRT